MNKQILESHIRKLVKMQLIENTQSLPTLVFTLNELNNLYWKCIEQQSKIKSPILNRLVTSLKEDLDIMKFEIEKSYPGYKLEGNSNGYNIRKK